MNQLAATAKIVCDLTCIFQILTMGQIITFCLKILCLNFIELFIAKYLKFVCKLVHLLLIQTVVLIYKMGTFKLV